MRPTQLLKKDEESIYYELHCPSYFLEPKYQQKIQQHFDLIFPDFWVVDVDFILRTTGKNEGKKADFFMIRKDYKEWKIVEVELHTDKLVRVKEQLKIFKNPTNISDELADKISNRIIEVKPGQKISKNKLRTLLTSTSPKVLLLLDLLKDSWGKDNIVKSVEKMFFQIYKNSTGDFVFRISGDVPYREVKECLCRVDKGFPNQLVLDDPSLLPNSKQIIVTIDGKLSMWEKTDSNNKIRTFAEWPPIEADYGYVIKRDSVANLYLERT